MEGERWCCLEGPFLPALLVLRGLTGVRDLLVFLGLGATGERDFRLTLFCFDVLFLLFLGAGCGDLTLVLCAGCGDLTLALGVCFVVVTFGFAVIVAVVFGFLGAVGALTLLAADLFCALVFGLSWLLRFPSLMDRRLLRKACISVVHISWPAVRSAILSRRSRMSRAFAWLISKAVLSFSTGSS